MRILSYPTPITIDLERLYLPDGTALLENLARYEERALALAGRGRDVTLTGRAPIWLYLRIAHALHGVARQLMYHSGQDEIVLVFDHASTRG
jgi:hypothetical protein